jgi:hypothetical protein
LRRHPGAILLFLQPPWGLDSGIEEGDQVCFKGSQLLLGGIPLIPNKNPDISKSLEKFKGK